MFGAPSVTADVSPNPAAVAGQHQHGVEFGRVLGQQDLRPVQVHRETVPGRSE
jgi:hypothetical protein